MRCFYHQDREAVGACKSCNKGLCSECAVDLGKGLACRGRCEADVEAVIQLIDQNVRQMADVERIMDRNRGVLNQARSTRYATGVLYCVLGAIFTIVGVVDMAVFAFAFAIGFTMLVYGIYLLARQFPKEKPPEEEPRS